MMTDVVDDDDDGWRWWLA